MAGVAWGGALDPGFRPEKLTTTAPGTKRRRPPGGPFPGDPPPGGGKPLEPGPGLSIGSGLPTVILQTFRCPHVPSPAPTIDATAPTPASGSTDTRPTLSGLVVYPIKSCRGLPLEQARVGDRGLAMDRRWMLVDPDGRFLTQRDHPRLARIRPRPEEGRLVVEAPDEEPLKLPLEARGEPREVQVWRDRARALDQGDEAASWFEGALGIPCRLVRQAPSDPRSVNPEHARRPEDPVAFQDGFPFHLTAESSLADLNRRLTEPLPMNRFRPNLVVAGAPAYAEDRWSEIRIGEVRFSVVKPCARCATTTVDQDTGVRGREPLRTLSGYRRGEHGVEFGQNLIHHGPGVLRRGAPVEVVAEVARH